MFTNHNDDNVQSADSAQRREREITFALFRQPRTGGAAFTEAVLQGKAASATSGTEGAPQDDESRIT